MELIHAAYEPSGGGPHPAIFAIHGWGANAQDLLGLAPYVCKGRFLFICPQGPVEVPIGPGGVGYGWFPLRLDEPQEIEPIISARKRLQRFVESCFARYPIDRKRVVALGFSQGGVMASGLALGEPGSFAAMVSLSSWLPKELVDRFSVPARDTPPVALVHHGSRDELLPVDRGRDSVETLRRLGLPVTYREYEMAHEISARSLSDLSAWLDEKILSPVILGR